MERFPPYLFDRLVNAASDDGVRPMLSLEQLKRSVALDVEALLNTRRGFSSEDVQAYPLARRSVVAFGLDDFVARSMSSSDDRAHVCRLIERAIADHEPRLHHVRVYLDAGESDKQRLKFSIRAVLHVHPMAEPVNFDAVLQPNTQQYAVQPTRRPAAEGTAAR